MQRKTQSRWDLFLLLSLLLVILMYPVLNRGEVSRVFLGALLFAPLISATVKLSQIKAKVWPLVLLMSSAFALALTDTFLPYRLFTATKWGFLTLFFGLSVAGLFTYLKNSRSIGGAHLYTAVSIYLLIGMQWFALYSAIDAVRPGNFSLGSGGHSRSSNGTLVLQPGNTFDARLRRHCSTARRSTNIGRAGSNYRSSLHRDHRCATGQQLQTAQQSK